MHEILAFKNRNLNVAFETTYKVVNITKIFQINKHELNGIC
jgi:hypothetical protein